MNSRLRKIERFEASFHQVDRAAREEKHNMDFVMGRAMLAYAPDLRLVTPEDTDAATYRHIRAWVCMADRQFDEADALRAQQPPDPRLRDFQEEAGGDPKQAMILWNRAQLEVIDESSRRTEAAIAAARARLGLPAKPAKERAPLPWKAAAPADSDAHSQDSSD